MKLKLKNVLSLLVLLGLSSCVTNNTNTTTTNKTTTTPGTTITTQPTVTNPTTTTTVVQPTITKPSTTTTVVQPTITNPITTTTVVQPTVTNPTTTTTVVQPTVTKPSTTIFPSVTTPNPTVTITDPVVLNYYASVDTTLSGAAFVSELSTLINTGYVSKSYSQAYTILTESDCALDDPSKVVCFYTGVKYAKGTSGSDRARNREHTWAKSHGIGESGPAYSDVHHLRATEMGINSTRGNLDFDEVENHNASYSEDKYGNKWIGGTCFEPRDEVKGDVARIMLYMTTKYKSSLGLSLVESIPTSGAKFGCYSTLLKWHYEDPVSEAEIYRNNVVYSYQKNRNPYIDHPEYVDIAFPNEYSNIEVDEKKVSNAIELINALPETPVVEDKEEILEVKAYIDSNLNAVEIAKVTNYSKINELLAKIEELENAGSGSGSTDTVLAYSYEFTSQQFSANGTKALGDISWTLSGDGGYWGYDGTKGQQFGSAKKPYNPLVLTSNSISNKITKIVIETSGASGISATLSVSVGSASVGSQSITTASTEYTFNVNSLSGAVTLTYNAQTAKALYIKSIKIYY